VKLGILATHPIQYNSPVFRCLSNYKDHDVVVFYGHKPTSLERGIGFGVPVEWGVDLLSGYKHVWLKNCSTQPNLQSFGGCDTPVIKRIIRQERFDAFLVMGWYSKCFWQAILACWKTGTPLLVRGDSHLHVHKSLLNRGIKKVLYPFFLRKFNCCLAVGKRSEEYFRHYGAKRIVRSPHCIDENWFRNNLVIEGRNIAAIRSRWKIPPDSTVYLFAGKFEEKKRPMDFLKAFSSVFACTGKKRGVYALLVGDGKLRKDMEEMVTKKGLPAFFTGFLNQKEIVFAYSAASVLVLPSNGEETWGLVVNEAMVCEVPVIISDQVGCGPDLVIEGKTGFVYQCGQIDTLAGLMKRFQSSGLSQTMGAAAKTHVKQFSPMMTARGILHGAQLAQGRHG
jgi:glycosyltransferase involved in cell wall biosynthesis